MMQNVTSFLGIFGIAFVGWLCSGNRRNINWRLLGWGIGLQLVLAFILFRLPAGIVFFNWINDVVVRLLSFAKSGIYFVFGPLAVAPGEIGPYGEKSVGFILAIQALPTIIFFSALLSLLYYLRIMQRIIRIFAYLFTKIMRLSGAESLCAASNIFVGVESVFTIRPYLEKMTVSELHTVLTAGMATIASSVLALYVSVLQKEFPMIAGHLVSASLLSVIAAVVLSKLIYPEDDKPQTLGHLVSGSYQPVSSWMESIIRGAQEGMKLCVSIAALLIAFLGILALCNWIISLIAAPIAHLFGMRISINIETLMGTILYPLVLLVGVSPSDAAVVAQLLGERLVLTEVFSYQHLARLIASGALVDKRSIVLASYALCGFAHVASLAVFVGGITSLVPQRTKDAARLGFRALVSATLACLMTAAVAGVFYSHGTSILFQ